MEHKAYKRIHDSADVAVLFIHGIVGTPNHFAPFLPLVPSTVSVYNLLLDGHGKRAADFAHTSMKRWEAQVAQAVDELARSHEQIYLVAHSMGCLFSIEQAVKNKKIAKLFLFAVPLRLFLKPRMFVNSLKVYFDKIDPNDRVAVAAKRCYGIAPDKNPFHYLGWIPRFLELFSKMRQTRKALSGLLTPCVAYQSARDELVSARSAACLKQNPCVSVVELKRSGHYYYDPTDMALLLSEFQNMMNEPS